MSSYIDTLYPVPDNRMFQDLIPGSPKSSKDFDGKAHSNVLKVFDISDSERYFGFVVYEFSKLVHTRK